MGAMIVTIISSNELDWFPHVTASDSFSKPFTCGMSAFVNSVMLAKLEGEIIKLLFIHSWILYQALHYLPYKPTYKRVDLVQNLLKHILYVNT